MQIKCSLDVGAWFDILSIYCVKMNRLTDNYDAWNRNRESFVSLGEEIEKQIGSKLYNEIYASKEYQDLYEINDRVFNLVDESERGSGLAKEVAEANRIRYEMKKALQKRFFNSEVKEVKV